MKFTVDLEEKKILIHDSFSKKDLDHLFSLLNIDNMDEYVIDVYEHPITYPNHTYPNRRTDTTPIQPYISYTNTSTSGSIRLDNITTSTMDSVFDYEMD